MKVSKISSIFAFALVAILVLSASGCANNPGVQGGNFAEQSSLQEALSIDGNTTVTLSGDETIDLNGISVVGRKQIFLNNFSLKLTGQYAISEEGVIDIKPGEGFSKGVIDLGELGFDTAHAPADAMQLSIIEIRPDVTIIEPQTGDGIGVQEFPDTLTAIIYSSAE